MKTKYYSIVILALSFCLSSGLLAQESEDPYRLQLGSVDFTPLPGAWAFPSPDNRHLLIQFRELPDAPQRRALKDRGVHLLRYVGGNAYIARVTAKDLNQLERTGARAILDYTADMKRVRQLGRDERLYMRLQQGEFLDIYIRFHSDILFEQAAQILLAAAIVPDQYDYRFNHVILAKSDRRSLELLLESDGVDFVDVGLPPRIVHNSDAAAVTNVKDVRQKQRYKKVSGKGVRVGVWDSGPIDAHTDLQSRITVIEKDEPLSSHATHVSGTIGGAGILNPKAKGMAPQSLFYSYDLYGDIIAETSRARQKYGVEIGNHSWGYVQGWYAETAENWSYLGDLDFGTYHGETGSYDAFVADTDFPFIKSAGNTRDLCFLGPHSHDLDEESSHNDLHAPNPDFGALTILSVAKNIIVVGATSKDKVLTAFSSTGPTKDGRVKPDVVAPGLGLFSTVLNNRYAYYNGTSMSAPVVTGVSVLLMHYYRKLGGERLGALLLKALLIHTAEDLGNPGPDYRYGFGMVDAEFAARVLKAAARKGYLAGAAFVETAEEANVQKDNLAAKVIRARLDNKDRLTFELDVPAGARELRATLVWHDPWGKRLVNDLDLLVKSPQGKVVKPFTLNPGRPTAPAVRKRNKRDNQEYILVENPQPGSWKVEAKGKKVPWGPQEFALVISAGSGNRPWPVKAGGEVELQALKAYHGSSSFTEDENVGFTSGDKLAFNLTGRILSNAEYNGYYGSVSVDIYMYNANGKLILKYGHTLKHLKPAFFSLWSYEYEIPPSLPSGRYEIAAAVTMHNGATDQVSTSISVY